MLRSLWLLALYLSFLGLGIATPFVMTLGYVWVDTFHPQNIAYIILNEMPVAFIMGGGAVAAYFLLDRRSPPPLMMASVLQILFAIWMTMSLMWAEVPDMAWVKWDWAFKAVAFAAFVPLVIRSRIQIEAFAQTYVFSLAANFVPFGLKVLISGGGYGQNLGLESGNGGLAEGGYLSTVCLMAVPLAIYLGKNGLLIPKLPMMTTAYGVIAGLAVITAIGTYERSALVGLVVLGGFMFVRSRRKVLFGALLGIVALGVVIGTADSWSSRVSTMKDYNKESSALTRILVWQWTLGYVVTHPLGGSFDSYRINAIVMPPDENNPGGTVQTSRAFHSSYFEVLGELGWPGLTMFLMTCASSMWSLRRLAKKCRHDPNLAWVSDMANAISAGLLVFLSCGAFVGLAFQPPFWYFVSMGISLRAYVWHAERVSTAPASGWRLVAAQRAGVGDVAVAGAYQRPMASAVATMEAEPDRSRAPAWRRTGPGKS